MGHLGGATCIAQSISVQSGRNQMWRVSPKIWDWANISNYLGIAQKLYEWSRFPLVKMIPPFECHFGKMTVCSLIYFLSYAQFDILTQSQLLGLTLYVSRWYIFPVLRINLLSLIIQRKWCLKKSIQWKIQSNAKLFYSQEHTWR